MVAASVLLVAGGAARADGPTAFAERGIDAYTRAMETPERDERLALLGEAERQFAAAIEAGAHNADLQTNLGNAALQQGRLGPAILAYRRALLLDPGHARARANLAHARSLLPERIPRPEDSGLTDTFFLWVGRVAPERLATTGALAFALGCGLLAAWILRGSAPARGGAWVAFAVWAGVVAAGRIGPANADAEAAVVVAVEAVARAADSINAPRRFAAPLPGGTEVRVVDDRGGWLQVALANGRTGWVTSSAIRRVGPGEDGAAAPPDAPTLP